VFGSLSVAAITIAEIVRGFEKAELYQLKADFLRFSETLDIISTDFEVAALAGEILGVLDRTGTPIGHFDPLIAATALIYDRLLVTGNTKHYQRIVELGYPLRLDNWRSM
jgi:tRNA(fMet)-specific endonuclease VapC